MQCFLRIACLTLAAAGVGGAWTSAAAQGAPSGASASGRAVPSACSLISTAEIDRFLVRGQQTYGERIAPDTVPLGDGRSACQFSSFGQVLLFSGPRSEEEFEAMLEREKRDREARTPISGVGDRAYIMFTTPQNQYQPRSAFLVTHVGQHTLGIVLPARKPETAESLQPVLVELGKAVVARLP